MVQSRCRFIFLELVVDHVQLDRSSQNSVNCGNSKLILLKNVCNIFCWLFYRTHISDFSTTWRENCLWNFCSFYLFVNSAVFLWRWEKKAVKSFLKEILLVEGILQWNVYTWDKQFIEENDIMTWYIEL